jgi:hypothetical protein
VIAKVLLELVFDLLDVPEKQNAALTSTVSRRRPIEGSFGEQTAVNHPEPPSVGKPSRRYRSNSPVFPERSAG